MTTLAKDALEALNGEQIQGSRERIRQMENEAFQKLRRLEDARWLAHHQEPERPQRVSGLKR